MDFNKENQPVDRVRSESGHEKTNELPTQPMGSSKSGSGNVQGANSVPDKDNVARTTVGHSSTEWDLPYCLKCWNNPSASGNFPVPVSFVLRGHRSGTNTS